ncbi:MAG: GFA family protein [Rhodospirillales bacterium]|nr:GFA family protein [Rhodospirillales bacterium]
MEGGCACGEIRYRMMTKPLFVHSCHCSFCQRQSGAAFAVNAMIETDRIELLKGQTEPVTVPTTSGAGQTIMRCPTCRVAVWSHYAAAGDKIAFVRAGSLDGGAAIEPDIHIFTSTKQPWVPLPEGKPVVEEYYSAKKMWPEESLMRMKSLMG